jgi:hypothetical protein
MIKKKAKRVSKVAKRAVKKGVSKKRSGKKKPMDTAKVREEIEQLVKAEAPKIAGAVIDHAALGELAPTRYLFEMAGIFPKPAEGEQATVEEDCLAKTLLARLDAGKKVEGEGSKEEKSGETSVTASSEVV